MSTNLPCLEKEPWKNNLLHNDNKAKCRMKKYADNKNFKENLDVGDNVLVKNHLKGKLQPPYNPTPCKIINKKGT